MYKGLIMFILLVLNSYSVTAQHNVIKGIGAGWPMKSGGVYTVGVGYERLIGNHLSMQLYFNHKGHQLSVDGGKSTYYSLIPEVRYYFKCQPDFYSSFFLAPFLELQRRTDGGGGEQDYNDYYVRGVQKQVSPGLLMGKNFRLSSQWHIEMYLGPKYRIGEETTERIVDQVPVLQTTSYRQWALRAGLNLAFRF